MNHAHKAEFTIVISPYAVSSKLDTSALISETAIFFNVLEALSSNPPSFLLLRSAADSWREVYYACSYRK